jgi:hypothetical protein
MNYNYKYKYKKYKSKYYKLKNIMEGGKFDDYISIVNMIVRKNLKYFLGLCKLDYEVGGFFNIKKKRLKKLSKDLKMHTILTIWLHIHFMQRLK